MARRRNGSRGTGTMPNPNRPKAQAVCLSCRFREQSEQALKQRQAADDSIARPYSGHMTGVYEGNILVSAFDRNVQVGFIAIPAVHVFTVTDQMNAAARHILMQQTAAVEQAMKDAADKAGDAGVFDIEELEDVTPEEDDAE